MRQRTQYWRLSPDERLSSVRDGGGPKNIGAGKRATMKMQETIETQVLEKWVLRLGNRNWRVVDEAQKALAQAGEAGLQTAIRGLAHSNLRVRRGCAEFMDHHGEEACIPAMCEIARRDENPGVRRVAVHSLSCQRCKSTPFQEDLAPFLIERATSDPGGRVRREAIYGLSQRPRDPRVATALRTILERETDPKVREAAHDALQRHDESYRQEVVAQIRARCTAEYERRKWAKKERMKEDGCSDGG